MNRPLRIAVFAGSFPVVSETFVLHQITALLKLGHHVDIYADVRPGEGEPLQPGVAQFGLLGRTTYMDMPPESAPWEMPVQPLLGRTWLPGAQESVANRSRVLRSLPALLRCAAQHPRLTSRLLRRREYTLQAASLSGIYRLAQLSSVRKNYDILHAHFGPAGNSYRFVRELWRAPFVVSFHGYDCSAAPQRQGRGMYDRLFSTADRLIANSQFMKDRLEELGCLQAKIAVLPYGIDLDAFPFETRVPAADETVRLITIARLVEKKGIEFVLRALAAARPKLSAFHYDIVGDGPLRRDLENLAAELDLAEVVTFHGAAIADQVRSWLERSHLFILASVTARDGDQEGTPVSLLEAQASGLPVIATRHAGIPEIVLDGASGLLVPERDVSALAEALHALIVQRERWPGMGRCGRAFVEERFSASLSNQRLLELYSSLRPPGP